MHPLITVITPITVETLITLLNMITFTKQMTQSSYQYNIYTPCNIPNTHKSHNSNNALKYCDLDKHINSPDHHRIKQMKPIKHTHQSQQS